jgi:hypothetical protein
MVQLPSGPLAESGLPLTKGIAMVVFFGAIAVFASIASFSSPNMLRSWSGFIGTNSPAVARIVCVLSALVGWTAVAVSIASLSGVLD